MGIALPELSARDRRVVARLANKWASLDDALYGDGPDDMPPMNRAYRRLETRAGKFLRKARTTLSDGGWDAFQREFGFNTPDGANNLRYLLWCGDGRPADNKPFPEAEDDA